jgi:1,4-alpha-glucan branching enzyme
LRSEPALYENQFNQYGFEWIDLNHREESVIVFRRKGKLPENDVLVLLNMTPVVRNNWKVYANGKSEWKEIFNSDERKYGGSGNIFNPEPIVTLVDKNENRYEINVHLPPLAAVILK